MGHNLPPGTPPGDPKAPWNREPPLMETRAVTVTLDVSVEVPEHADDGGARQGTEVVKAIQRGDYDVIEHETAEVLDRRRE